MAKRFVKTNTNPVIKGAVVVLTFLFGMYAGKKMTEKQVQEAGIYDEYQQYLQNKKQVKQNNL